MATKEFYKVFSDADDPPLDGWELAQDGVLPVPTLAIPQQINSYQISGAENNTLNGRYEELAWPKHQSGGKAMYQHVGTGAVLYYNAGGPWFVSPSTILEDPGIAPWTDGYQPYISGPYSGGCWAFLVAYFGGCPPDGDCSDPSGDGCARLWGDGKLNPNIVITAIYQE